MKSYCLKQKKQTECVPYTAKLVEVKNGRVVIFCTCAECGITKTKFDKLPENKIGGDGRRLVLMARPKKNYKQEILDKNKEGYCDENVKVEP